MRSTFFVILSLFVHALCVAAIAIGPTRTVMPEGEDIEVTMGEPAEIPGVANPPTQIEESQAPAAPVQIAKAAEKKTSVIKAPMEKVIAQPPVRKKTAPTAQPVPEPIAQIKDDKLDPEISAEPPPAESQEQTATPSAEGSQESSGESPTAGDAQDEAAPEVELAQGGATQAGAVSYLDLKQVQGNKSPSYPLQARREARQGLVELVYRVTKDGRVADVQIAKSSGHKDLDQEALRAVAMFKFVPGQEGWARHPVNFALKGEATTLPSRLRSAQTE